MNAKSPNQEATAKAAKTSYILQEKRGVPWATLKRVKHLSFASLAEANKSVEEHRPVRRWVQIGGAQ